MKIICLLLSALTMIQGNKIIRNVDVPSCRNCIYYKPFKYDDHSAKLSKCERFGEKDIITNKIQYDYADSCRNNESKCGKDAKYFEEDKNVKLKIFRDFIIKKSYYVSSRIIFIALLSLVFYFIFLQ